VSLSHVMQVLELFKNQLFALLDLHVQQQLVILQEVASTIQLFVNQLDVLQLINVTQLQTNVNSSFQIVMMEMHVLLTVSFQQLDVFTLLFVLLLTVAQ
jgi:hypothetical protein